MADERLLPALYQLHEIMLTRGSTMAKELLTVDVTNTPDLRRLAEEVRRSGQPRLLRLDNEDLAVLSPVEHETKVPSRKVGVRHRTSVAEATFGAVTPRQRPEDFQALRRQFEEGVAEDVITETAT